MWVSGARPRERRPPRGRRERLPAPRLEAGRAGAEGALTGGGPAWCLWGAFVASAVQHLHKINGGYFRRLSPEALCPAEGTSPLAPAPGTTSQRHRQTRETKSNLTQPQLQPHPAPDPASLSTKSTSFSTKSQLTPSSKSKHSQHQIRPHATPNPARPRSKSTTSSTKSNHTQLQIQPHSVPNLTTPGSKSTSLNTKSSHTQLQI